MLGCLPQAKEYGNVICFLRLDDKQQVPKISIAWETTILVKKKMPATENRVGRILLKFRKLIS